MILTKHDILTFLDFPVEWEKYELYSAELWRIQYNDLLETLGERELAARVKQGTYGPGSEHYRVGAAFYTARNGGGDLELLKKALMSDSDKQMAKAVIRELKL